MIGTNRVGWLFGALLTILGGTPSCHSDPLNKATSDKTTSNASLELVEIPGGSLTSGFSRGLLRQGHTVAGFQISKHPVTWADFAACVKSGKCEAADDSACAGAASAFPGYSKAPLDEKADTAPAVCVGEKQAEAYCKSVNGRLPTLDEWFMAARGASPRRFSWGDTPTSCAQHPFAAQLVTHLTSLDPGTLDDCAPADAGISSDDIAVGKHPTGASPTGVEDVLLSPGELVAGNSEGLFMACQQAGSHCVVSGADPGAIDGIEPFYKLPMAKANGADSVVGHMYGFRCVVGGSEVSK